MRKVRKKLTADEVRALPVGSRVTYHSHDNRGYSTELECEVVQVGQHKELRYSWMHGYERMKIIKGRHYTVEVREDGAGAKDCD